MKQALCLSVAILVLPFVSGCQSETITPERRQAMDLTEQAITVIEYDRPAGMDTYWRAAVELLEQAIQADSTYAKAWAVYVLPRMSQAWWEGEDLETAIAATRAAADRAVLLDSTLAYAYFAEGIALHSISADRSSIEAAFERALALDSTFAEAQRELAVSSQRAGRFPEALEQAQEALEMDPESIRMMTALAAAQVNSGRFEEALETVERVRARDPLDGESYMVANKALIGSRAYERGLALAEEFLASLEITTEPPQRPIERNVMADKAWGLVLLGRLDEAMPIFQALDHLYGETRLHAVEGRREEATEGIAEMERRLDDPDQWGWEWGIGDMYLALGDTETAIGWLEKAHATRVERDQDLENMIWWLRYNEFYDPIRDDPRIKAILNQYPV